MKTIRRLFLTAVILLGLNPVNYAQSTVNSSNLLVYSFFVNVVPDQFNIPLVGFINIANGSHKSAHIGFVNYNQKDFLGVQVSFINTTEGNTDGMQVGFINTSVDSLKGGQVGFINTVCKKSLGGQVGFVNTSIQATKGVQVGFVNTVWNKADGIQVGFVNTVTNRLNGAQVGFVNTTAKALNGFQVGFVNTALSLNGLQLGFVNYADSLKGGIPIGFVSIVRKGGYQAVELSCTEMYPVNLSFKIGVKSLYSSLIASYNPNNTERFALGAGLGSIIPISEKFFFNPEVMYQHTTEIKTKQLLSLSGNFGYSVIPRLSVLIAPSLVWNHTWNNDPLNAPFFSLYTDNIDAKNSLHFGARLSIRYSFGDAE